MKPIGDQGQHHEDRGEIEPANLASGPSPSRDRWSIISTLAAHSVAARFLVVVLLLTAAGCASVAQLDTAVRERAPEAAIRFGRDTFAFPNESQTKNRDKPDLYANYCFVMTRGAIQFQRFARFEPARPRLGASEYAERVRQVVIYAPWREPLPADDRVVIPGYASLYEFSRDEEAAVKEGLGGKFWTMVHWTNWRVVLPVPGWHQERLARVLLAEIQAGRPVQLLVTNLPKWELNHGVIAYDYHVTSADTVEFVVYDPNDPYSPGVVTFDRVEQRFVATRIFDTTSGGIRAFRMDDGPLR